MDNNEYALSVVVTCEEQVNDFHELSLSQNLKFVF